jgi:hypothetical protein
MWGIEGSLLNPFPQDPAPSAKRAFNVQPGVSFLNNLEGDPRIHDAAFLSMRVRCIQERGWIILKLDLHNV